MMQKRKWRNRIFAVILAVTVLLQSAPMNLYAAESVKLDTGMQTNLGVNGAVTGESAPKNQEFISENVVSAGDVQVSSGDGMIAVTDEAVPIDDTMVSGGDSDILGEDVRNPVIENMLSSVNMLTAYAVSPLAVDTTIATLADFLQLAGNAGISIPDTDIETSGDSITALKLPNDETQASKLLVLLSNTNPTVYQNASITIVGSLDLTQTVQGMTFAGLGRESAPYSGQLIANADVAPAVTLNYSLFEAISQDATNTASGKPIDIYFNYQYDGTIGYVPLFAQKVCEGTSGKISTWHFHVNNSDRIYGLIGENAGSQGIQVDVTVHKAEGVSETELLVQPKEGYAGGLICGTMTDGAKLLIGRLSLEDGMTGFHINVTDSCPAGGLVGSMEGAELVLPKEHTLPGIWTVESTGGAAGGIVGSADNATLHIYQPYTAASDITVSAPGGAAGILAGNISAGTLLLNEGWRMPQGGSYAVSGKYVGEVCGTGENIGLSLGSNQKLTVGSPVVLKVTASGGSGGGLIGSYILDGAGADKLGSELTGDIYEIIEYNISDADVKSANVYCGGIFGSLVVKNGASVQVSALTVSSGAEFRQIGYHSVTGGLFGRLYDDGSYGDGATRALTEVIVQDININLELSSAGNEHAKLLGGLIGQLGDTNKGNGIYLEVSVADSQMNSIYVPRAYAGSNGFGGVAASVGRNCVVNIENVSISNKLNDGKWRGIDGAGLIATLAEGAAVRLGGTIDLSDVYYYHDDKEVTKDGGCSVGQLIGVQNSSLIYGTENLNLIRGNFISSSNAMDNGGKRSLSDIGNYGGVVRLSDFIKLDASTHRISIAAPIANDSRLRLGSEADFVKLAITMQSHGYFSGVSGITTSNYSELFAKGIDLSSDIDLTGTGVYSLTRDTVDSVKYTGDLQGQGGVRSITLATGEKWGKYRVSEGNVVDCATSSLEGIGQIYSTNVRSQTPQSHNRLGLFGEISGQVTFKDVKLSGTMDFGSNMDGVHVGGLAAYATGAGTNIVFDNVTTEVTMTYGNENFGQGTTNNTSRVGGFVGYMENISSVQITDCVGQLQLTYTKPNDYTKFGGLIAEIGGWDNKADITICDTILSNNIQYNMTESTTAWGMYGGGLIGLIYGNGTGTMTLAHVQVKGQVIEGNVAGGNAGGLLGYHWEKLNVVFTGDEAAAGAGLNVLASEAGQKNILRTGSVGSNKLALGGLCYEASGYWQVNKHGISLKDWQVDNAYGTLGLILNRGYIGSDQGIYLELTDAESYEIDAATVIITKAENKEFDELIYDTTNGDKNKGLR